MDNDNLIVAIWMVTYNHEKYIEQAIQGVLNQKTDFNFKLIIGEDCSTDSTREICLDFEKKHPTKVAVVLNSKNIGAFNNGIQTYRSCLQAGAKYIAMCEGDDYWFDENKLQKQVDFLELNLEYSLCCTAYYTELENKNNNQILSNPHKIIQNDVCEYVVSLNNFLSPYILKTVTALFRCSVLEKYSAKALLNNGFSDIFLFSILLKEGLGLVMKDKTAVYRIHEGGIWSMKPKKLQIRENLNLFREMKKFHQSKVKSINSAYLATLKEYFEILEYDNSRGFKEFMYIFYEYTIINFSTNKINDIKRIFHKVIFRMVKTIFA